MTVAMPVADRIQADPSSTRKLFVMRKAEVSARQAAELRDMFLRAVKLEESPATIPQATEIYQSILNTQPEHAATLINLGTIHYNLRCYELAEQYYRRATVADPEYALAFFNLGNTLDETQHLAEAIEALQKAVALAPQYADAHYNLARAYELGGQPRRALRHWRAYVRLDPNDPSANYARERSRKILSAEKLSIVSRRGQLV
jgi:tetratricopeptide (TPR) repeat protein